MVHLMKSHRNGYCNQHFQNDLVVWFRAILGTTQIGPTQSRLTLGCYWRPAATHYFAAGFGRRHGGGKLFVFSFLNFSSWDWSYVVVIETYLSTKTCNSKKQSADCADKWILTLPAFAKHFPSSKHHRVSTLRFFQALQAVLGAAFRCAASYDGLVILEGLLLKEQFHKTFRRPPWDPFKARPSFIESRHGRNLENLWNVAEEQSGGCLGWYGKGW